MARSIQKATDGDDPIQRLERFLADQFQKTQVRNMLDAGCGYKLPLDFPPGVRIIGIDASPDSLAKNQYIDSGIVGDIETYSFAPGEFDAVLCWTVLEHLANPSAALSNMAPALRPGGLLIIGVPNLWSLKGLVTKLTPHRFHVWAYRHLWGYRDAGTPGFGPFRTYHRRDIAPNRLMRIAREENLERIYASTYEVDPSLPRPLNAVWSALAAIGRIATLGRWNSAAGEYVAVFRKIPEKDVER